jgi:Holliday junction resolvasome RuvABC endonuclease subunit
LAEAVNIIGLDLSMTAPGLCTYPGRAESLRLDAKDGDRRFCAIRDWLVYHIHGAHLALAVIEATPPYHSASASLERVHGVAREVLARHDVPFAYVSPSTLKLYATGNGNAGKAEMIASAAAQAHDGTWIPADSDQADAWHLQQMGRLATQPDNWPASPRRVQAMSSVRWPLDSVLEPYGPLRRQPVTKKCGHKVISLKNGDHWLHPFTMAVCDRPPK